MQMNRVSCVSSRSRSCLSAQMFEHLHSRVLCICLQLNLKHFYLFLIDALICFFSRCNCKHSDNSLTVVWLLWSTANLNKVTERSTCLFLHSWQ